VKSLRNWIEGNSCIAREETQYLDHERDLFNIVGKGDNAMACIQPLIEDFFIQAAKFLRLVRYPSLSCITMVSESLYRDLAISEGG
jgi:hypothetical protein